MFNCSLFYLTQKIDLLSDINRNSNNFNVRKLIDMQNYIHISLFKLKPNCIKINYMVFAKISMSAVSLFSVSILKVKFSQNYKRNNIYLEFLKAAHETKYKVLMSMYVCLCRLGTCELMCCILYGISMSLEKKMRMIIDKNHIRFYVDKKAYLLFIKNHEN